MKTAMQEAIDYLREFNLEASAIILEDKFLEKEKEQIIDAWIATDNELQRMKAEEYYNQTYKQTNGIVVDAIKSQVTTTDVWSPKTN